MNKIQNQPITSPNTDQREGAMARTIEQQTSKLPSDTFLWLAGGSVLASLAMKASGKNETANFIGQWAPTILIMGLYNKMVKLQGSDGL